MKSLSIQVLTVILSLLACSAHAAVTSAVEAQPSLRTVLIPVLGFATGFLVVNLLPKMRRKGK